VEGISTMPGTPSKITVGDLRPCKVAASGGWRDQNTFEMLWRFYETPHSLKVTSQFDGGKVNVEYQTSYAHKGTGHPEPTHGLVGVAT
jgi:hypothetical protein